MNLLSYLKYEKEYSDINVEQIKNEIVWHNIAYYFGIRRQQTASTDAFFYYDDI